MKKIKLDANRLHLLKTKVFQLQSSAMRQVNGGQVDDGDTSGEGETDFTYSLSMGQLCKKSNYYHAWVNAYQCGRNVALQQANDR